MLDFYIKLNALPLAIYYPNSIGYFTKSIDLNGLKSWLNAYTKSAPFERLKVKCNEWQQQQQQQQNVKQTEQKI